MPFNTGQLKAIQQRNSSILVSAPAGSGKTKILVSRIVELLKEGYQIYDFLVLTFTEAAGNEMKQRLNQELNELIASDIDEQLRTHLSQQIQDLPNAYITNFHGFCNLLLMKYGYLVHVMPGFNINPDPTLLKKEAFEECITQWIHDSQIKEFLSLYFPGNDFESFQELLFSIDDISHSINDFYQFVEDVHQNIYSPLSSLDDWPLFPYLKDIFYQETISALNKLIELKVFCEDNSIVDFYERPEEQSKRNESLMIPFDSYFDYLEERRQALERQITYDTFVRLIKTPVPKSYTMSWKEVDPNIKSQFTKLKTAIMSSYKKAITLYIPEDEEDFIQKMSISYQAIDLLLSSHQLLNQFQQVFQRKKKEKNQLDFSDLEQYTHQLLEPQYGVVQKLYHSLKEIMVDEYQDTNQIQESLLLKIARHHSPEIPLFMVGDMKQSIYRFRQADPQIFSNKYDSFSLTDEECEQTFTRRVDLVFNYRSSKIVLDSINYIFNQIMDRSIGGLEYYYDDSARLNYDYDGKEKGRKTEARERFFHNEHLATEVLIDVHDRDSKLDKEQYEAHMVAQKIIELKKDFSLDNKPIQYKDIAILMRSTPSFLTFKKVFDLYHIPNHIVLSQGLMQSLEITEIKCVLQSMVNPYDDVSLLSVLTQPYRFSHIDMNTLASLRIEHKDITLYETLQLSDNPQIIEFLTIYEDLRSYALSHSPYDFLLYFLELSDYQLFVSQLINGEQRKANIDLFVEIVKQLQIDTPYLKDLNYILDNSSDYAPAYVSQGNDDVVEFMTIHKSKGLEFPVVFVCNTHKEFNTADSKKRIIIDKQLGMTLKPRLRKDCEDYHDIMTEYDHSYYNILSRKQVEESINEEMRILYVALTRASQKLVLTGVVNDIKDIVNIQQKLLVNEDPDTYHQHKRDKVLLYDELRRTNNYLTWILASILKHPYIIQQCFNIEELNPLAQKLQNLHSEKYLTFDSTEHAMFSLTVTHDTTIDSYIPKYNHQAMHVDSQTQEYYINYQYPYDIDKTESIAVTQLHEVGDDHYLQNDYPTDDTVISATDRGTLVHLLLSYLTFKEDNMSSLIQQLYEEDLIDEQGQSLLITYMPHIQSFIDSPYYQMIKEADYIYKEKPFSYYDETRQQIVHGIFDLVFIHHGQVYVLDYKTDRIRSTNNEKSLIQKHEQQLNYYKLVLKEMYKQDIKAIVYYLHTSQGVEF